LRAGRGQPRLRVSALRFPQPGAAAAQCLRPGQGY